jgi:hypothetical protein
MTSQAQQSANSANAQLSTGPRTEAGKAQSAQNARKHGLTAVELLIPFEDREEFEVLHADYETDIRPQGALQQSLFDELVASAWNLRRIRRMETDLCSTAKSYSDLLDSAEIQTKLDRLGRHKARIERTFHRSLRELKALQTNEAIATETRPPLASAIEIARFAKRTQSASSEARGPVTVRWIDSFSDETNVANEIVSPTSYPPNRHHSLPDNLTDRQRP